MSNGAGLEGNLHRLAAIIDVFYLNISQILIKQPFIRTLPHGFYRAAAGE